MGWQPVWKKATIFDILMNEIIADVDVFGMNVKVCFLGQCNYASVVDIENDGERCWDMEGSE